MSAMFLVAGYFAVPSLRRRGAGGFLREKLIPVGAPWVSLAVSAGILRRAPILRRVF